MILDGIFEVCGVKADMFRSICSAVDKLDKSPWDEVRKEMVEEKGLDEAAADRIGEYVRMSGGLELVDRLLETDLASSKIAKQGLEEMKLLLKYCDIYGCGDSVSFDVSLARGLDYYTGVIYEAVGQLYLFFFPAVCLSLSLFVSLYFCLFLSHSVAFCGILCHSISCCLILSLSVSFCLCLLLCSEYLYLSLYALYLSSIF